MVAFPLSPVRSGYAVCSFPTRNGVFYASQSPAPSITLSQAGATGYTVRNYAGTIVSSGSVSGTTVTPTAPAGGWAPGWYRIYLTGPVDDALFGTSYGVTNFVVLRPDAHFPTMPAVGTSGGSDNGVGIDQVLRGVVPGLGPQRYNIGSLPVSGARLTELQAALAIDAAYYTAGAYADAARPRELLASFSNGSSDRAIFQASGQPLGWQFYVKDTSIDGSLVTVDVTAGTLGTNRTIRVYYPDPATLVETFSLVIDDNTAPTGVNEVTKASAYIRGFTARNVIPQTTLGQKTIGNTKIPGVTAIVAAVPEITWWEGPQNEPDAGSLDGYETAHATKLLYQAVKAGRAAAKVLAPNPISTTSANTGGQLLAGFLAAGGGAYVDGYSVHAYNMSVGDLNRTQANWDAFVTLLTSYGEQAKPRWQTEQGSHQALFGVFHPRRARWQLLQTLAQEQHGIPREHNHVWYDLSHGFWSVPIWNEAGDTSLLPHVPLLRVLGEETWGKAFEQALTLPGPAARMFLASSYLNPTSGTRTLVLMPGSAQPLGKIVLSLAGSVPSSVTTVDGFGVSSTISVAGGKVTVPVTDLPTYVRLPAGCTATVAGFNDWPIAATVTGFGADLIGPGPYLNTATASGAGTASKVNDGVFASGAYAGAVSEFRDTGSLPASWQTRFDRAMTFDRVIIWAGPPWQVYSTPLDFDVQTSTDGSSWTTRVTVNNVADAVSFLHGADATNTGCQRDTYWQEQHVFDLKFPARVTAQYVRLYVRTTSYGGEPDSAATTAGGQGDSTQHLVLQEVGVYSDDTLLSRYVTFN